MLVDWLREHGHDVRSIEEERSGLDDRAILQEAVAGARILITNDKDFGTLVFVEGMPHCGVIFLRLTDERSASKIAVVARVLEQHGSAIENQFVVASETRIRFGRGSR